MKFLSEINQVPMRYRDTPVEAGSESRQITLISIPTDDGNEQESEPDKGEELC